MDPQILALVGFAIAASATPGPNNMMVAANAAANGVAATVPQLLGIGVGFSLMIVLVGLGVGQAVVHLPGLSLVMRIVGMGWILVMAWRIATAPPPSEGGAPMRIGFGATMLFQWINPKAWLLALSIAATFVNPNRPLFPQLVVAGLVFLLVGPPCSLPWALLGSGAARVLGQGTRMRVFNGAMALLLVASMLPVVLDP